MTARKARPRFVADAMLGSLARKLRSMGFETAYYREGDDSGLLRLASREDRVILTSDRGLASRAASHGVRAFLLAGKTDSSRIASLAAAAGSSGVPLVRGDPLCSLCGGALQSLGRREVAGMVPRSVEERHRLFFRCASCGHLYWRGSHWKKLRSLARRLGQKRHGAEPP